MIIVRTTTSWSSIGGRGGGGLVVRGDGYPWDETEGWLLWDVTLEQLRVRKCACSVSTLAVKLGFFLLSLLLRSARNHSSTHLSTFLGSRNYTTFNTMEYWWVTLGNTRACVHALHPMVIRLKTDVCLTFIAYIKSRLCSFLWLHGLYCCHRI